MSKRGSLARLEELLAEAEAIGDARLLRLLALTAHVRRRAWNSAEALLADAELRAVAEAELTVEVFLFDLRHDPIPTSTRILDRRGTDPSGIAPGQWIELVEALTEAHQFEAARSLAVDLLSDADEAQQARLRWLIDILSPTAPRPLEPGAIRIGVISYRQPNPQLASTNLGDPIQTLAGITHLSRLTDVELCGDPDLASFLSHCRTRMKPEHLVAGIRGTAHLVSIDRDASSIAHHDGPVWVPVFGWFMHRWFTTFDLPLHPAIRPIFSSIYVNEPSTLTPDAVDYLRRYGPIGCRDWSTVYLLREHGVPAFFSGCMTSTIDSLFHASLEITSAHAMAKGVIDPVNPNRAQPPDTVRFTHVLPSLLPQTPVEQLRTALDRLDQYRAFSHLETSRLHCYLPATAIGIPVRFRPKWRADPRFEGLYPLAPEELEAMRDGIRTKMETFFRLVFSGASEEEVYARWRELCASDVAAADARCQAGALSIVPMPASPQTAWIPAETTVVSVPGPAGETATWAIASSLAESTTGAVRLLVSGEPQLIQRLKRRFPDMQIVGLDLGNGGRADNPVPIQTLSASLGRVILLNGRVLPVGDLRELATIDLKDRLIAARPDPRGTTGYDLLGNRLRTSEGDLAARARRLLHGRGALPAVTFDPGVLVIDLAGVHASGFSAFAGQLREEFGFSEIDALRLFVGGAYLPLEPEWNRILGVDVESTARIVQWPDPLTPQTTPRTRYADAWDASLSRMAEISQRPSPHRRRSSRARSTSHQDGEPPAPPSSARARTDGPQ